METRSIKQLLEVVLAHPSKFDTGLCHWTGSLRFSNLINKREESELDAYIYKNRPSKYSSFKAFKNRNDAYFWPQCDIEPRIKWLKKHILLHQ